MVQKSSKAAWIRILACNFITNNRVPNSTQRFTSWSRRIIAIHHKLKSQKKQNRIVKGDIWVKFNKWLRASNIIMRHRWKFAAFFISIWMKMSHASYFTRELISQAKL